MKLTTLKARLALAETPRRVALNLGEHDKVRLTAAGSDQMAEVEFCYDPHRVAISFYLFSDGSFRVSSSGACPVANKSLEFLATIGRANDFVKAFDLRPEA